jgi:sterol desaturase/sphingolipid hydroxylase (fatty acid hydroxylase superfamily)
MLTFFIAIDWCGHFQKYRLHKSSSQPPRALLVEAAVNTIATHLLLQMLSTYYLAAPVFAATGALSSFVATETPGALEMLIQFALCILIHDTAFYWTHRMLHTPLLYRTVHKRHHTFTINHPIAVEHAHVAESLVANLFPMFLPCVVLRVHGTTFSLWFGAMLVEGSGAHSGFALPWSPFRLFRETERHAFHHSYCDGAEGLGTSGCYGGWLHLWDWACGTDAEFLEHARRVAGQKAL